MLSIFAIPKPFHGHDGVIQRNAIRSWTLLRPECQVILVGDEDGTKEVAGEFGVSHAPEVALDEYGTPREDSVLQLAEQAAQHPHMCYVASDVILMSEFARAVERVKGASRKFAMFGQRWNLKVTEPLAFDSSWEEDLCQSLSDRGRLFVRTGMDYLVYPRGLFVDVPPFSVGRGFYDAWLLYAARRQGADLVDATGVVKHVHQDHDYSLHDINYDTQFKRNEELSGTRRQHFMTKDRTHVLTATGLKRTRDLWRYWRLLRTFRALHPSAPAPLSFFVETVNSAIDLARNCYEFTYLHLGIKRPHQRTSSK